MKMDDLDLQIKYTPAERQFLLYEYFQKHTNKEHPVSRKEILDYLETFEIYISPHSTIQQKSLFCVNELPPISRAGSPPEAHFSC